MYYHEIEQKDVLNSRISIPLGVITLMSGGSIYVFQNLSSLGNHHLNPYFYLFFIIYNISLLISIIFTIKSYYGYEYQYIPFPHELQSYTEVLANHYLDNYISYFSLYGIMKNEYIEQEFTNYLAGKFQECTDRNIKLNERKIKFLRIVGWFLILSIIAGIFMFLFFYMSRSFNSVSNMDSIKILINFITNER